MLSLSVCPSVFCHVLIFFVFLCPHVLSLSVCSSVLLSCYDSLCLSVSTHAVIVCLSVCSFILFWFSLSFCVHVCCHCLFVRLFFDLVLIFFVFLCPHKLSLSVCQSVLLSCSDYLCLSVHTRNVTVLLSVCPSVIRFCISCLLYIPSTFSFSVCLFNFLFSILSVFFWRMKEIDSWNIRHKDKQKVSTYTLHEKNRQTNGQRQHISVCFVFFSLHCISSWLSVCLSVHLIFFRQFFLSVSFILKIVVPLKCICM